MLKEVIKDDPSPYVKYIEYIEEDKYRNRRTCRKYNFRSKSK